MAARGTEALRERMEQGSLNLRGVAAALRRLAEDLMDKHDRGPDDAESADILQLLARDVDLEADAMGEAEVYLLSLTKAAA